MSLPETGPDPGGVWRSAGRLLSWPGSWVALGLGGAAAWLCASVELPWLLVALGWAPLALWPAIPRGEPQRWVLGLLAWIGLTSAILGSRAPVIDAWLIGDALGLLFIHAVQALLSLLALSFLLSGTPVTAAPLLSAAGIALALTMLWAAVLFQARLLVALGMSAAALPPSLTVLSVAAAGWLSAVVHLAFALRHGPANPRDIVETF